MSQIIEEKVKFLEQELLHHRINIQQCHEILNKMNAPKNISVTERLLLYWKGQREEPLKELLKGENRP